MVRSKRYLHLDHVPRRSWPAIALFGHNPADLNAFADGDDLLGLYYRAYEIAICAGTTEAAGKILEVIAVVGDVSKHRLKEVRLNPPLVVADRAGSALWLRKPHPTLRKSLSQPVIGWNNRPFARHVWS